MKPEPFRDRVVIITGASAGIGKALAIQLAGQGAKVAIAARRAERLEQIAAECRASGGEVLVIPTDVSDESQCKNLIERTVEKYGQLDMLINNAGMAASALLDEFPDLSLFRQTMDINFYGTVYCTYYALPHLKQSKGRIVAVSSLGGKSAIPYNTPYCSSKYADAWIFRFAADGADPTRGKLHSHLSVVGGNRIPRSTVNQRWQAARSDRSCLLHQKDDDIRPVCKNSPGCRL